MTRFRFALAGALVVLACLPAAAFGAWSAQQQVVGKLSTAGPVIGVDEAGTMAVGLGGLNPATYIERPAGLAAWNSAGVVITQITGAPPSTAFALSSSGAAVATWSTGSAFASTPWAAYKPPGGPWRAATQLDGATGHNAPVPVIDAAGHAAVVWARKSIGSSYLLNMPDEIVYAVPSGAGWATPVKIAGLTVPDPHDKDPEEGFSYNRCGESLRAAMLPDGTPLAVWNDDYASYKQSGGVNDGAEQGLCSVRAALAGGSPVNVTPRPNLGWYATPTASMPSWTQLGVTASPTDTDTAVVLRGREDALVLSGCSEVDACFNPDYQTRVALGSGSGLAVAASNLTGNKENAWVALRDDRVLVATYGAANGPRAGVGNNAFPTLAALPETFVMLSAGLAVNGAGAAHVAAIPNNTTTFGLRLFDAPAAAAFAGPQVVDSSGGANRTPSLALDCKGLPVMAWSRSSDQIYTSVFDTAPSVCGDGPGPEPETEGPKPGGGGTPAGPTVIQTPPPVPSTLATIGTPKTDGSKVTFTITCSPLTANSCGGKTVITESKGGGKKARAAAQGGKKIGSLSFSGLKPGAKKTLKVPLIAAAKQALKAGKGIKATIVATVNDGAGNVRTTTRKTTLKLPS